MSATRPGRQGVRMPWWTRHPWTWLAGPLLLIPLPPAVAGVVLAVLLPVLVWQLARVTLQGVSCKVQGWKR